MDAIVIRGARENNLKAIDLDIPRGALVVITGLSGSGKSSLAFDTIYAEGQRRYVESLSAYARQFLEQLGRPNVDTIEGLSPAISIEQKGLSKNPRSTVGTVTEIYDHLRLLYARVGKAHCPRCGKELRALSIQEIVAQVYQLPASTRFSVLAPIVRGQIGGFEEELNSLRQDGYTRVNVDGEMRDLSAEIKLNPRQKHQIDVYVDRLVLKPEVRSRLTDSIELAARLSRGIIKIAPQRTGTTESEGADPADLVFSEKSVCLDCDIQLPDLEPRLFSFNSPQGACERCSGLGVLMEFDEEKIIGNPKLSLKEGAIEPWEKRNSAYYQQLLDALASQFDFDLYLPYKELPAAIKHLMMKGSGETEVRFEFDRGGRHQTYQRPFEGVVANLQKRLDDEQRRQKEGVSSDEQEKFEKLTNDIQRYMTRRVCPDCQGSRLRVEANHVFVGGKPISKVARLDIGRAIDFFSTLQLSSRDQEVAERLLQEISGRLSFLSSVGLDYLSLDRTAATLSGGEGQRVRLATQIGASLVGVLYVLDEPSIGLHQRDSNRLLNTLLRLKAKGNTVIVVEHDESTIREADFIVDMGPGAGAEGGRVVATGTPEEISRNPQSITGLYLSGSRRLGLPRVRRSIEGRKLSLSGANLNNLKDVDIELPLGTLIGISGVSGSGKSSLIIDTLLPALRSRIHGSLADGGSYQKLQGVHHLDKVVAVNQDPIGRTPRSNPATFTGIFGLIRDLFASLPESKVRGYKAGRFSFNVKGGRCEACKGDGILRVEMHFLPDVYVPCEVCSGKRYNEETLRITYKGLNIAQVLDLTASEALQQWNNVPKVRDKLQTLCDVGLGYLTLGQSATTLSGGEAQRLKLGRELSRKATGKTIYILDEPTTGLHFADIQILLEVLNRLVQAKNTVVVIEHNLDVLKSADYLIDLGPDGGHGGGEIIAAGPPEEVARIDASHTGRFLRQTLSS